MNNLKQHITALKHDCYAALAENEDLQGELIRAAVHTAERSEKDKLTLKQHIQRLKNTLENANGLQPHTDFISYMVSRAEQSVKLHKQHRESK